jgi:argonaute-like protein implicated in RNA metabolism and viral defense
MSTITIGSLIRFGPSRGSGHRGGGPKYYGCGIVLDIVYYDNHEANTCGVVYWADGLVSEHYLSVYELLAGA